MSAFLFLVEPCLSAQLTFRRENTGRAVVKVNLLIQLADCLDVILNLIFSYARTAPVFLRSKILFAPSFMVTPLRENFRCCAKYTVCTLMEVLPIKHKEMGS